MSNKTTTLIDSMGNKCYPRTLLQNVYGLPEQVKRIDNLITANTSSATTDMTEVIDARTVGDTIYDNLYNAMNAINDKIDNSLTVTMSQTTNNYTDFVSTNDREILTILSPQLNTEDTYHSYTHMICDLYDENKKVIEEDIVLTNNSEEVNISKASYIKFKVEIYNGKTHEYPNVKYNMTYKLSKINISKAEEHAIKNIENETSKKIEEIKNISYDITQDEKFINNLIQNESFTLALASNPEFDERAGMALPQYLRETLPSDDTLITNIGRKLTIPDSMFMSSMTEALPRDDGFMSEIGSRIRSFVNETLPKDDKFMTGVGKRIGSFWDGNCASQTAYALANNTASYLPSFMASYCVADSMFMSSIAAALPKNDAFEDELVSILPSKLASEIVKDERFQNAFTNDVDLMCSIGNNANVGKAMAENSMLSDAIASYLPERETFINSVGSKMANVLPSTGAFISDTGLALASNTTFMRSMANVLPSYISSTLPSYIAGGLTSDSSFLKSVADNSGFGTELATNTFLQSGLAGNDTFMCAVADKAVNNMSSGTLNTLASVLPSNTTFMNNVAKIASNYTFISTMTTDPLFMNGMSKLANNSYFMSNMVNALPSNNTFMDNITKVGGMTNFAVSLVRNSTFRTLIPSYVASNFKSDPYWSKMLLPDYSTGDYGKVLRIDSSIGRPYWSN